VWWTLVMKMSEEKGGARKSRKIFICRPITNEKRKKYNRIANINSIIIRLLVFLLVFVPSFLGSGFLICRAGNDARSRFSWKGRLVHTYI
jgi:hypothetical protein